MPFVICSSHKENKYRLCLQAVQLNFEGDIAIILLLFWPSGDPKMMRCCGHAYIIILFDLHCIMLSI